MNFKTKTWDFKQMYAFPYFWLNLEFPTVHIYLFQQLRGLR